MPYFFLKYPIPSLRGWWLSRLADMSALFYWGRCLFDGKWDGYMQAPQGVQPTVASLPMHCPRIQLSR